MIIPILQTVGTEDPHLHNVSQVMERAAAGISVRAASSCAGVKAATVLNSFSN